MRGSYIYSKLLAIGNVNGDILTHHDEIAQEAVRFFEGLFGDSSPCMNEEDRVFVSQTILKRLDTQA
ncbi:hypothetical protein LIER_18248 [Lithospermum erythrorhizon]|uniref:Uncharacterized protein n=1 Tax=Lithospermum erythrorhizon TaxID=34254 RepID=A0AAV3QFU5_LITER